MAKMTDYQNFRVIPSRSSIMATVVTAELSFRNRKET